MRGTGNSALSREGAISAMSPAIGPTYAEGGTSPTAVERRKTFAMRKVRAYVAPSRLPRSSSRTNRSRSSGIRTFRRFPLRTGFWLG